MITVTQKIELSEVMKFLVTTISTMNENVIAIAIPWKALDTKALSTATLVQAVLVYFMFFIVGAAVSAILISSSMKVYHFSIYGALTSPGLHAATLVLAEIVINLIFPFSYNIFCLIPLI